MEVLFVMLAWLLLTEGVMGSNSSKIERRYRGLSFSGTVSNGTDFSKSSLIACAGKCNVKDGCTHIAHQEKSGQCFLNSALDSLSLLAVSNEMTWTILGYARSYGECPSDGYHYQEMNSCYSIDMTPRSSAEAKARCLALGGEISPRTIFPSSSFPGVPGTEIHIDGIYDPPTSWWNDVHGIRIDTSSMLWDLSLPHIPPPNNKICLMMLKQSPNYDFKVSHVQCEERMPSLCQFTIL